MTNPIDRAQSVFLNALEVTSNSVREAYLDAECKANDALRAEVEGLLEHAPRVGRFLENDAPSDAALAATMHIADRQQDNSAIGPYKLREKIGEGGMGEVYVAEQKEPVRRKVALKVIKPGMATKQVVTRFEAERQALAIMDHPNIANVLDGGATPTGQPFFVMELVRGKPITEYCDQERLATRERLELFLEVCRAVQHAHQKGVIHRDLKPSNVLVSEIDGRAVPKVIDFGVAKAVSQKLTDETLYTQFEQVVGTPLYMSPEQASSGIVDIDTRSDIYSLGVLLYELLTGITPFDRETLKRSGLDEFRRILREEDPRRPSDAISTLNAEALSTITDRRGSEPRKLQQLVRGELDWIVMKAMEKDRSRRYESASALAADIQHYLADEPVQACPPSVGYRLQKYVRRHKSLLTTAALLATTLLSATGVSVSYAFQANQEANKASAAQARSEQNLEAALDAVDQLLRHVSNPELGEIPRAQPILKNMLADSLEFYQQFRVTSGDSPALRFRAAQTKRLLANLASSYGEIELAIRVSAEGLADYDRLLVEFPDEKRYLEAKARLLSERGWFYVHKVHDHEMAEDHFQSALRIYQELGESAPPGEYRIKLGEALIAIANSHQARGNYAEYRRLILKADEEYNHLHRNLPMILSKEDPDRAESLWLRIIAQHRESNPENYPRDTKADFASQLLHAADFFESRDAEKAAELVDEAASIAANLYFEFPEIKGYKTLLIESVEKQLAMLDELDPRSTDQILDKHGLSNDSLAVCAIGQVQRERGQLDSALSSFSKAVGLDPGNAIGYYNRGYIYWQLGQHADAIDEYTKAIELDPQLQWAWCDRGKVLATRHFKRYREAVADFDKAIQITPLPHFYEHRALAHFHLQNFDQAISDLTAALERDPSDLGPLSMISAVQVANTSNPEFQRAMRRLADRAVELNVGSPAALLARAALLIELGEWEAARRDHEAILEAEEVPYYALYKAALLSLALNDRERHRQLSQRMVASFSESEQPLECYFTGWTSALAPDTLEDYSAVLSIVHRSVENDPKSQQFLIGLGAVQMRAGQYEKALDSLNRADTTSSSENTSNAYAAYIRSMTLSHLGRMDECQKALDEANDLYLAA